MKISLDITNDSHMSYPNNELEFEILGDEVEISISDYDRKICVNKKELEKVLILIKE